jgi:Fic family protein
MRAYDEVLKMWEAFNIQNKEDLEKQLDNFKILFAYHSNKIENEEINYNDTREIFERGKVIQYNGTTRTIFEQQNQKTCYDFLLPYLENKKSISIDLIKEIHRILTMGTYDEKRYLDNGERPGEFKKADYVTGVHEVGVAASHVEEELEELLLEINLLDYKERKHQLLTIGTYFHVRFEEIHPFADGNGRVGRTLLNYFLIIHNHPPVIIFEEDKQFYYESLQKYDETEDTSSLEEFFIYQVEKTWKKKLTLFHKEKPVRIKNMDNILKPSND